MIEKTLEEVFTYEAIYRAHIKGRLSKRDKKPLVKFEMCTLQHIYTLYDRLINGKYKFGAYNSFVVYEPKKREIQTLYYSARVVQHVLCDDVLMPYFSKRAIIDNCVCQVGKGSHFALRRFENMLAKFTRKHGANGWFLKCDVLKYFPSIPHFGLKETFCTQIKDKRLRALVESVIDSYHTNTEYLLRYGIQPLGTDPSKSCRGLPIGNQTSQVFGMYYLNAVDRLVKEKLRVKIYSRYMDDLVLVHEDKEVVKKVLSEIRAKIAEMGLYLNSKTQIFPLKNGVTYLGFRYFVTPEGKIIKTVKKKTKRRLRWRARLLKKACLDECIDFERVRLSLAAMHGHLKHARSYKIEKELFKKLCALPGATYIRIKKKNAKRK